MGDKYLGERASCPQTLAVVEGVSYIHSVSDSWPQVKGYSWIEETDTSHAMKQI